VATCSPYPCSSPATLRTALGPVPISIRSSPRHPGHTGGPGLEASHCRSLASGSPTDLNHGQVRPAAEVAEDQL